MSSYICPPNCCLSSQLCFCPLSCLFLTLALSLSILLCFCLSTCNLFSKLSFPYSCIVFVHLAIVLSIQLYFCLSFFEYVCPLDFLQVACLPLSCRASKVAPYKTPLYYFHSLSLALSLSLPLSFLFIPQDVMPRPPEAMKKE